MSERLLYCTPGIMYCSAVIMYITLRVIHCSARIQYITLGIMYCTAGIMYITLGVIYCSVGIMYITPGVMYIIIGVYPWKRPLPCISLSIHHITYVMVMRMICFELIRKFQRKSNQATLFKVTVKVLPAPNSLSTVISPPCASINSLLMVRPSPVPSFLVPGTRK